MTNNQLDRPQDSHTYHYDSAQRFTKMERGTIGGTPSFYQGYTLDALANWSSFNNNGTTESRSHDVMNAITARGATSLSHDLNGNLTNDGNQKYIWDELNRLVEVRDSGNNIICDYYYNADNLRVEKHHAGGAKEQYYYDRATILVETDGSQSKVREYVNGGQYIDEVILVVNGSTYNYYMSDLRYCVTGFIDSSGSVVERARYDGYGKRTLLDASYATITTANVDQSYGYTGIRHDNESGLQYYRARYFDNDLGRFINRDPLSYVDGLNLYRGYFVISGVDPFGMQEVKPTRVKDEYFWEKEILFKKPLKEPTTPTSTTTTMPEGPCKEGDQKIQVDRYEWAEEEILPERYIHGFAGLTDKNIQASIAEEDRLRKLLDKAKHPVAKGADMAADVEVKKANHNSNDVKIRRGHIKTVTTIWECDCNGNWKVPPKTITRTYVEDAWTRE